MKAFTIDGRALGLDQPTYFIADIAANHDGSLDRARALIRMAKEAGADAAKFQHFRAEQIVSEAGFSKINEKSSHQASWTKSVVEVFREASVPADWTPYLKEECDQVGITFLSTPYDFGSAEALSPYVQAFKVGSGDINWLEFISFLAAKGKPLLIATGASALSEVDLAVSVVEQSDVPLVVMQCNTNYTGDDENHAYVNLRVIPAFVERYQKCLVGLSDHTTDLGVVLGAVAMGARVIERHFTDDTSREGPDHSFAMDPSAWDTMVRETRKLELSLGDGVKKVEANERAALVVQRRSIRFVCSKESGEMVGREDLELLRPYEDGSFQPSDLQNVVGRKLKLDVQAGEALRPEMLIDE